MARAFAGDSTMTRLRAISSGVPNPPQEILVDLELLGLGRLGLRPGPTLARVDLDEPDPVVREDERRIAPVDEHGTLAIERPDVGTEQHEVARLGLLEKVGDDRLIAEHVDDGTFHG